MSLAERMKILKDKEEQWKNKGKGAANDSIQFTVAGRMAKRGKTIKLVCVCVFIQCGLTHASAVKSVLQTLCATAGLFEFFQVYIRSYTSKNKNKNQ